MKLMESIIKSFKENMRDWKVLLMTLLFAPLFVLLMYAGYGGDATTYKVQIVNYDLGAYSQELIHRFEKIEAPDGSALFDITIVDEEEAVKKDVMAKSADIGIVIPVGYSLELMEKGKEVPKIELYGSLGNSKYAIAVIIASNAVYEQGMAVQEIIVPEYFNETFLEKRMPLNEFESMVPALMALSVLMILFTGSASIVKENDNRTILRLKLSSIGAVNYLGGVGIVQAIITTLGLLLTYATALLMGYKSSGDFAALLVVGMISSVAMVAVSLVIASFLNTIFDVLTVGCIPFFVMMFFSGGMFPLPKLDIVTIGGRGYGFTDLIPLTHTTNAFNKILNYNSGFADVTIDIALIIILSVLYMIMGVLLYKRRRLSKE